MVWVRKVHYGLLSVRRDPLLLARFFHAVLWTRIEKGRERIPAVCMIWESKQAWPIAVFLQIGMTMTAKCNKDGLIFVLCLGVVRLSGNYWSAALHGGKCWWRSALMKNAARKLVPIYRSRGCQYITWLLETSACCGSDIMKKNAPQALSGQSKSVNPRRPRYRLYILESTWVVTHNAFSERIMWSAKEKQESRFL